MKMHKSKRKDLTSVKVIEINSNTYAKKCVLKIKVIEKDNKSVLWIQMRNIQDSLSIKNMFDLTIKAIKGFYQIKFPTKERIENTKDIGLNLGMI